LRKKRLEKPQVPLLPEGVRARNSSHPQGKMLPLHELPVKWPLTSRIRLLDGPSSRGQTRNSIRREPIESLKTRTKI
jgi:hypothetical protein